MDGQALKSVEITVNGIVQGVGFRPFVARQAQIYAIKGSVCNYGGIVKIIAEGDKEKVDDFIESLSENAPLNASVTSVSTAPVPFTDADTFQIIKSGGGDDDQTPDLSPDLPMCGSCLDELYQSENRRFDYPFISCSSCGPRYSIMDVIPYDRCNTVMDDFDMCEECSREYSSIQDRRFHAQTLSCHDCGPYLIFQSGDNRLVKKEAFLKAVDILKDGGILAVKGIGGYHFVCSPFMEQAVKNLRLYKRREQKPFAVMFGDVEALKNYCEVTALEETLLTSPARPIVLLARRESDICESVYNDSRFLGAFLPYTPLQQMLIDACGPLIMTSANFSGEPIIKDDGEMLGQASGYLSGVLYSERKIRVRLDDSVVKAADGAGQVIRFSRGYAPLSFNIDNHFPGNILACGGDLKASFCLVKKSKAYLSQYIGDLEDADTYDSYCEAVAHLSSLLKIKSDAVVCDLHPGYFSSRYAEGLGLPILKVQHHFAHIASVMAEHRLTEPVIGVAFDGTGYGDDKAVWGGEFFVCTRKGYLRRGHLEYVRMNGGDAAAKDCVLCAKSYLYTFGIERTLQDSRYDIVKKAIEHQINTVQSSSMGRLFDAVSAILGFSYYNHYEGQSAIILENQAFYAKQAGLPAFPLRFEIAEVNGSFIPQLESVFYNILLALQRGIDKRSIALGFHEAVADMVLAVCQRIRASDGIRTVALSGGVFQNLLLFERCLALLRNDGFMVYYNKMVPLNDNGIAFGQMYIATEYFK